MPRAANPAVLIAAVDYSPRCILRSVVNAWTPALGWAWTAEAIRLYEESGHRLDYTGRDLAACAMRTVFARWQDASGPEYVAHELRAVGTSEAEIAQTVARAFKRPATDREPVAPPLLDELLDWLRSGYLLTWWREAVDEPGALEKLVAVSTPLLEEA